MVDFYARCCANFLAENMFKVGPLCLIAEIVVRGNAVQMFSNFPAKSLVYRGNIFCWHLLIKFHLTN